MSTLVRARLALLLAAILLCCSATGIGQTPPVKSKPAEIEEAIGKLAHDEYSVREAASKQLWEAGLQAAPALRKAAASNDPEVKMRAQQILEKFELGLTPDMPPEFEALLTNFRTGDVNSKRTILTALVDEKKVKLALQLARSEKDSVVRDSLVSSASRHAQRFVPEMVISDQLDEAESILEAVDISADSTLERLSAVLLLTGKLPDRLKDAEEKLKLSTSPALVKRVMYYRRASGDLAGAAELAGKHQLPYYQRAILLENNDWAGAAAVQEDLLKAGRPSADTQAYAAALQFFAGNQAAADKRLLELRTAAKEQVSTYWDVAEAHLVCEHPEEAIRALTASLPGAASYFHFCRLNYAESQRLGGVTPQTKFDKAWYDSLTDGGLVATQMRVPRAHWGRDLARQLHMLGERERAKEIVAVLRTEAANDKSGGLWGTLLSADLYLNDRTQALVDLQDALGRPGVSATNLFSVLYKQDHLLADALYSKLGSDGVKKAAAIALVEKLLGPAGYKEEERTSLTKEIATQIEAWYDISDYRLHLRAGEIFVKLDDRARARRWFERAASSTSDAAIRLGDLAREEEDWDAACKWYRKAFERLPALPLPRYLLGECLIAAGKKAEGEQEQRRASLAALAPVTRYAFAFQLKERGLDSAAAEQAIVLQRTSNPTVQQPTLAAGHLRGNIVYAESPAVAADNWQRWLLSQLAGVNNYTLFDHYLADPELIHRNRARALLAAGKPDAAITELRRVLIIIPGNVRMIEQFVPLLEKADRAEIAGALLNEVADRYKRVIRDYPHTAHHRRELALMLARCNRRLDEALALASKAAELEADVAVYHDTLAEVHFVRNESAAAIRAGERALALERNNPELQRRQKRWREGTK